MEGAAAGEECDIINGHRAENVVGPDPLKGDEVGRVRDKGDLGVEPGGLLLVGQGPEQARLRT